MSENDFKLDEFGEGGLPDAGAHEDKTAGDLAPVFDVPVNISAVLGRANLSVAQLLENDDLIVRAKQKGARILVPTGALIGLDAVRGAAEGTIHSIRMVTRKPPAGLEGAPYLRERGISLAGITEPLKVFDGTAREGARGFPTNVNVAAALSLAGIGPDRTHLEIWADPDVTRNTHTITVDADTARFTMTIENVPSDNPRTGKSVAPSTIAALRALVSELKIGS